MNPIVIPDDLIADRAVRRLIAQWNHLHSRYRICTKRVNWRNSRAMSVERRRRQEKWRVVARILEIERTILRWCAKSTRHPDLWMSKKPDAPESRRVALLRFYYENRRLVHHARGKERERWIQRRTKRVEQIRALDRAWMVAVFTAVNPGSRPPAPIALHPRELFPRKLKRASQSLAEELAA